MLAVAELSVIFFEAVCLRPFSTSLHELQSICMYKRINKALAFYFEFSWKNAIMHK